MVKKIWAKVLLGFVLFVVFVALLVQIPSVNRRLAWRLDVAQTRLRGLFYPAGGIPTPIIISTPKQVFASPTIALESPSPIPSLSLRQEELVTETKVIPPTLTPTPLPQKVNLQISGWEKQDWNNCGPATLAMYLRFYGWQGDQYDISDVLKPIRGDRNVNVEELVYYARNYAGWLNTIYRVGGNIDLLKRLLAAGMPVMIESSFYFEAPYWRNDDLWAAHYLLVTGYDDTKGVFVVQDSYHGANQKIAYDTLDEYWHVFNRVYILAYPPEQDDTVRKILGSDWEEDKNRQQALETAQAEIETNQDDAFAWFNLGTNLVYFERYEEAADAYDIARNLGLPQRMLRYQFGPFLAYFHSGRIDDLLTITKYALQRTPNSEEALLWRGWALYRKGDVQGAIDNFNKALDVHPDYADAQYALNFLLGK